MPKQTTVKGAKEVVLRFLHMGVNGVRVTGGNSAPASLAVTLRRAIWDLKEEGRVSVSCIRREVYLSRIPDQGRKSVNR